MNIASPRSNQPQIFSHVGKPGDSRPPRQPEPAPIADIVSRGVGVVGGSLQVVLKTPRNAIAPFLLPPRRATQGEQPDIPRMAKDPELTRPWGIASSLGGAIFLGALAGLCIGGPIAVAVGAGVGAKLFRFVDDKLADRARADGKAPVFVVGALAKGDAQAGGASSFGVWSSAFSTMSKSSYVAVRDFYTSKVGLALRAYLRRGSGCASEVQGFPAIHTKIVWECSPN